MSDDTHSDRPVDADAVEASLPAEFPGDAAENAYRQYLMPGIFGQTVAFAAASSTVGLAEDMHKGLIDRFRALPMSPPAVLLGRTFADASRQILVLFVLSVTGYLVGWRINNGLFNAIWAYALLLLFAYTVAWIGSWIGLYMPNPETANTAGLVWLFPLTFLSNAFVPISWMPSSSAKRRPNAWSSSRHSSISSL